MLCTRDSMSQAFKKSQGGLRPATIKCLFQNIKREGLIGRIFLFFSIPCIFTDLISSLIHTFDTLLYICILFPSYHMSLFLHLSTYFFTQIPSYLFILYDSFSVALLQALSFPPSLLSSLPLSLFFPSLSLTFFIIRRKQVTSYSPRFHLFKRFKSIERKLNCVLKDEASTC